MEKITYQIYSKNDEEKDSIKFHLTHWICGPKEGRLG
jgi:hypothetical protein